MVKLWDTWGYKICTNDSYTRQNIVFDIKLSEYCQNGIQQTVVKVFNHVSLIKATEYWTV